MSHKKALVTGASSGIGEVFARELAKKGYDVTGAARGEDKLKQLTKELGDSHDYIAADLADAEQLETVCAHIRGNRYDLVINNAGYGLYRRFEDEDFETWQHMMTLNMNALVKISHVYLENAKAGDALINVSSALSRLSYPGGAIYCGTKGFVTNFTESLWYEYKDKDIYVTALLPGLTVTNFHQVALGGRRVKKLKGPSYPPEVVVKESLNALEARKKPSLTSGPKFRFLVGLVTRLIGRKKMIKIMGSKSPAMR